MCLHSLWNWTYKYRHLLWQLLSSISGQIAATGASAAGLGRPHNNMKWSYRKPLRLQTHQLTRWSKESKHKATVCPPSSPGRRPADLPGRRGVCMLASESTAFDLMQWSHLVNAIRKHCRQTDKQTANCRTQDHIHGFTDTFACFCLLR